LSGTLNTGDSFTIFSTAAHSGSFAAITGSPGIGKAWSFNTASGVLSVVTGVATNPTNITFAVSGSTLDLSWPQDHTGWTLQTNAVSVDNTNQWFAYPGSTATNHVVITILSSRTNVFFRLLSP